MSRMSHSPLEVGAFTASIFSDAPPARTSPQQRRGQDASEVEFLKREVMDLERVIKQLHASRTEDRYALEQAEARADRAIDEGEEWRASCEERLQAADAALQSVRVEHTAAMSAAASREAEVRTLNAELRVLGTELFDAEGEREAARESEGSALSIARSYRSFAAQGAARLEEMRAGIEGVQGRLSVQLMGYQGAATRSLASRSLRSLIGWRMSRSLYGALVRWTLLVFTAEQRSAVAARLEAAYRYRDAEAAAKTVALSKARVSDREAHDAQRAVLKREVDAAARERSAALAEAEEQAARRRDAEAYAAKLVADVAAANERVEAAKVDAAADSAALREEMSVAKREAAAASAAAREAREGQRVAEGELEGLRKAMRSTTSDLDALKAELHRERTAREEEAATRAFLERVLRDERLHAASREEEAEALAELREQTEDLADDLQALQDDTHAAKAEIHTLLLQRAMRVAA